MASVGGSPAGVVMDSDSPSELDEPDTTDIHILDPNWDPSLEDALVAAEATGGGSEPAPVVEAISTGVQEEDRGGSELAPVVGGLSTVVPEEAHDASPELDAGGNWSLGGVGMNDYSLFPPFVCPSFS